MAEADAGVGEEGVDRAVQVAGGLIELVHALLGREVGLQRLHLGAAGAEALSRFVDLGLVGHDQQVEAVVGA